MPKFLDTVQFTKIPVSGLVVETASTDLASPVAGQLEYRSDQNYVKYYNGTAFISPQDRAQHFGTQPAATISDLPTVVKLYSLDQFAAPVAPVSFGGQLLRSLGTPVLDTDAATLGTVKLALDAALNGVVSKSPVAVVATTNQALSGLPTIDGVTLTAGQRILLPAQTTASQNGVYVVASGAWARAQVNNDDTQFELDLGATWLVLTGTTYASTKWRITSPTSGTITPGTTAITITQVDQAATYTASNGVNLTGSNFSGVAAPGGGLTAGATGFAADTTVSRVAPTQTITGDGSTTSFTITHTLGKQFVLVRILDSNGNYVEPSVRCSATNTVIVNYGVAPASGVTYTVLIYG